MQVQPYLFFEGRCEEALEFYREALGAEIKMLVRMKDNPEPNADCGPGAGNDDKVLHACFAVGGSDIMASDGMCSGRPEFNGVSLSLTVDDAKAAERAFARLADGGQVQLPLGKTFFSPCFGMVADRFGVSWMVIVPQ
jgi:PhnB protein